MPYEYFYLSLAVLTKDKGVFNVTNNLRINRMKVLVRKVPFKKKCRPQPPLSHKNRLHISVFLIRE